MGMTNDGRPLEFPDNPLTRAMASPPTTRGGISATPPPSVKSGAWGTAPKMTEKERQELDEKLATLMAERPMEQSVPEQAVELFKFQPSQSRKARVNFNNIQRIDLEREVIVVDDMEFPLAPDDVKHLRLLCVDCVLNAVVQGLRDMLGSSGVGLTQLTGMLREDVLGRRQEAAPLPEGPGVSGTGEGTQDTMAP